jgi:hypothetical protein
MQIGGPYKALSAIVYKRKHILRTTHITPVFTLLRTMGRGKGPIWAAVTFVSESNTNSVECLYCGARFAANTSRICQHLVGGGAGNVRRCLNAHKMTEEVSAACTVIAAQSGCASLPSAAASTSMLAQKRQKRQHDLRHHQCDACHSTGAQVQLSPVYRYDVDTLLCPQHRAGHQQSACYRAAAMSRGADCI